jgi:hypothetical protein
VWGETNESGLVMPDLDPGQVDNVRREYTKAVIGSNKTI